MTTEKHIAPQFGLDAFNCPHCGAYSIQRWLFSHNLENSRGGPPIRDIAISVCWRCEAGSVWIEDRTQLTTYHDFMSGSVEVASHGALIYPDVSTAPMPHDDMPEDVKEDYLEARTIVSRSPRGAVALLRLCVQKLMPHLGEKGKKIDDDIKSLVSKGLPDEVQQALDSVRVIGNEAVHPGEMALEDDVDTAMQLFDLLNFIVQEQITRPKQRAAIYNMLPQSKLDGIKKRDGK